MLASAIGLFALTHAPSPSGEPAAPVAEPVGPAEPPVEPAARTYEGAAEVSAQSEEPPPEDAAAVTLSPRERDSRPRVSAPAREDLPARHRVVYRNLIGARYNPLGLVDELFIGYRLQLARRPGLLWRDSFLATNAHMFLNPSYVRVGPWLELQPLRFWQIAAGYDFAGYFGAFNQLASFPSPSAAYDDETLDARGDAGLGYPSWGHLVTLLNLLQFKVKGFVLRDGLRAYWNDMKLRRGDRVWFDLALDILMPDRGWALTNDLDALWVFDFGLTIGARHTLTHAFYQQKHFRFGEPVSQPNGPTHRVGPAVLYTFFDRPGRSFNRPTIIVLAQWWARHRYRTGEVVSAAVPYFVLAFAFEGDLWPRANKQRRSRSGRRR